MKRLFVFSLLFWGLGSLNAQNDMRVPLKQGYDNPAVELEGMKIELTRLYVQSRPWNDQSSHAWLAMTIITPDEIYETTLYYYEECLLQGNFSRAIGNYLFNLDVREDSVYLQADTLKFGDIFIFNREEGRSIRIGTLTITYDSGYMANLVDENGDYDGYEIGDGLKLSEQGDEEVVTFLYVSTCGAEDNESTHVWKGYKIEILDNHNAPLRLRVTKE